MATAKIYAKSITQPNAGSRINITTGKANCSYWGGSNEKYYREWTNIGNIINGRVAQCGSTESGSKGVIKHIGSPTGTYPQPAQLHLYNFNTSSIPAGSKINYIKVSFQYRVINISDKGKIQTNVNASEKAIIRGVTGRFSGSSSVTNNANLYYMGKNNSGYIWRDLNLVFRDVTVSELKNSNFALNLQFGMNCSKASTPCILYISGFTIYVDYNAPIKYMTGNNNKSSLYTSTNSECKSSIIQTIEAGYKTGTTKIPVNNAPEKLGKKIIKKSAPSNVSVQLQSSDDLRSTFLIQDSSDIAGEKTITYCLSNDSKTTYSLKYNAIKKAKPSLSIIREYKYKEDFDANKSYIIFNNGCANKIKMFIDGVDNEGTEFTIANPTNSTNLLSSEQIQAIHNIITNLPCGYHDLYFQRGGEPLSDVIQNKTTIKVSPMEFKFKIYSIENPSLNFEQSRNPSTRYAPILIQRIDDEPKAIIDSIAIIDETNTTGQYTTKTNIAKGDIIDDYQIDKYYGGDFYLKVQENSVCKSQNPSSVKIHIENSHKQNYDYLFTDAQDGTAFDFDYLVVWEGDNIKSPIQIEDITLINSTDDIRICSKSEQIGISRTGSVELLITNTHPTDNLEDIKLELNVLTKTDDGYDVTTEEWTAKEGIFNNFYNLFKEFNQGLDDNVFIKNLTSDNDLVEEENVYLLIKSLKADSSLKIQLPYSSPEERKVYLQFLLFEVPQKIYPIYNCTNSTISQDQIEIAVIDSMQSQLEIFGELDLLTLDQSFDCPTECYTTTEGITYRITNVDTSDFSSINTLKTEIINNNEVEPYKYCIDGVCYDIDEPNNKIEWIQQEILNPKPLNNQIVYAHTNFLSSEEVIMQKTNSKGVAEFYITIPDALQTSYTISELLSEVLYFKYNGKDDYNESILAGENNPYVSNINFDINKNQTILSYNDSYRKYEPGETVYIPVILTGNLKTTENKLIFKPKLSTIGSSDEITILYRICNLNNNEGIFTTTFQTNHELLIPNKVSEKIYCGIGTNIDVKTKINRNIVELEDLNVVRVDIQNQNKINKDVSVQINLGPVNQDEGFDGSYTFLDINIDQGDYSVIQDDNNNIIVTWLLGKMNEYQKNVAIIKIKAQTIGLADVQINVFDYLHNSNNNIELKNSKCEKCDDKTSYKTTDSLWTKINGTWYKLINNEYYQRVLIDNKLTWVKK